MSDAQSTFQYNAKDFPQDPGTYLMKNAQGKVLYVGKAKNLRARLSSYFRGELDNAKTRALVERVVSVDVLVTATEKEALLLEASLIKKHRPRYNIVLRDDKDYILFKLDKSHAFPRLAITRRVVADGSLYFGPFTSAKSARQTWRELGRMFPLRKCRDTTFQNRVRPCLYYHLKQSLAPCVGYVSQEDYQVLVRRVEAFLSGHSGEVIRNLQRQMYEASENLDFERAAEFRDLVAAMKKTIEGQAVVLPDMEDLDALGVFAASEGLGLSVLFVRQGRLLDRANFFWPGHGEEDLPEVLPSFLAQFYRPESFIPAEVLLPKRLLDLMGSDAATAAEILAERRGAPVRLAQARSREEVSLAELAGANAARAVREAVLAEEPIPALLGRKLHLGREIGRIEAVDVSHLGGKGMRAGMVVFEDGRFKKEDYRNYAFPELEGTGDDYAALARWVERRIDSGPPWADLVLVDGGKGQLATVERGLAQAGLTGAWELASIAKAGRSRGILEDQIFRPGRKNPLNLRAGGKELLFLQRLRDAVHDFTVGTQRRARKKTALKSEVLSLPGIGPKTAKLLWERFGNLEGLRAASLEDLAGLPGFGQAKAEKIHQALESLRKH